MAEPITNLTANWVDGVGVELNWTAAEDVTAGSSYEIFVLINTFDNFPLWNLVTTLKPNLTFNSSSSTYFLNTPVTSYVFPWDSIIDLANTGNTSVKVTNNIYVGSLSFSISHFDVNNVESISTNISSYTNQIAKQYGSPHLVNQLYVDPWGQFATNPQDSYEEISSNVAFFMGTQLGQRTALPYYGVQDLPFSELNTAEIQKQIAKWETRAQVSVNVKYDEKNKATLNVNVKTNSGGA